MNSVVRRLVLPAVVALMLAHWLIMAALNGGVFRTSSAWPSVGVWLYIGPFMLVGAGLIWLLTIKVFNRIVFARGLFVSVIVLLTTSATFGMLGVLGSWNGVALLALPAATLALVWCALNSDLLSRHSRKIDA